jgi:hypothetical protein
MRYKWKLLHRELNKLRETNSLSWRKLAQELEVTPSLFTRISHDKPISVLNLAKVINGAKLRFTDFWEV